MGGSSKSPTEQTVTQTNIPEEFLPYFKRLMGRTEASSREGYQPYGGARIAGSDQFADIGASQDLTRQTASQGIAGLSQAQAAAMGNLGRAQQLGQYNTGNFSQFGGFQATQATPFSDFQAGQATPFANFQAAQVTPFSGFQAGQAIPFSDFSEAGFREFGFGPAGQFTGSSVGQYMNPYMQNVVDIQKGQAQEDYDIARQGRNARAVSAGAFGGSRAAVQEGLAERDLLRRQGDIQAQGLSTAYGDAQRMFGEDRAARMTTEQAQAAERARVQGGSAGEAARVQQARAEELARTQGVSISEAARVQQARAEELARTQGISVAEAARIQQAQADELARTQGVNISEAARVQQARAEELARTQGISVAEAARIQAAQADELGRVQTGTEASRQFGAGQGLAALQASGAAADQLAGFGQQERAAQIQNAQMLEAIGRAQQGEAQAGLDIGYQDFLRQQNYPKEQLAFYSDVLRGLPVAPAGTQTQTGSVYTNPLQQALGAGLSGLSLYKAFQ
jgi:hypothetical protein